MSVTLCRMAPDEPLVLCQGCGVDPSTARLETMPDVDDVEPADLHLCSKCLAGLKGQLCAGTVTPGSVGGKVGRRHPDQSKKAAATVQSGSQQAALLSLVCLREGVGGVTCYDAADPVRAMLGRDRDHPIAPNQIATRMGELAEMQLVTPRLAEDTGEPVLWTTTPGNSAQVWIATPAGHAEAQRLAQSSTAQESML